MGRCCRLAGYVLLLPCIWLGWLLVSEGPSGIQNRVELFGMRFFRDLSRAKSEKRRFGNEWALVMLGAETLPQFEELPTDGLTFTPDELAEFGGHDDDAPLYLAIRGRVYDVSQGRYFYGPDGPYNMFAGGDETVKFATWCRRADCEVKGEDDLSEDELLEANRWVDFFEHHDKYKFIGTVADDHVDAVVELELRAQEKKAFDNTQAEEQTQSSAPTKQWSQEDVAKYLQENREIREDTY